MSSDASATAFREDRDKVRHAMQAYIAEHLDLCDVVSVIAGRTSAEISITGSSVRSALLYPDRMTDIDFIVRDRNDEIATLFRTLGLRSTTTYLGHPRTFWGPLQLDFIHVDSTADYACAVTHVLESFDLCINGVAFDVRTEQLIDPFDILSLIREKRVGINWSAWRDIPRAALVNQCIRLLKVLHESPQLALTELEKSRLKFEVVPLLLDSDWSTATQKYPLGRASFLERFRKLTS